MLTQIDLEDLIQRCRSKNARAYIKEAVDAYRIGAYRACIITTWIALVYDVIDKLRELGFTGDHAAESLVKKFDEIQRTRDTEAALAFERDVLKIAKDDFELITAQEHADLARLFEDRNRCGHPNLNRENEVYTPPPELARLHLRTTIEHVLERPPVQGKAALSFLQQTVESDYFPDDVEGAERVLRATPLAQAKQNLIHNFVRGCLISIMRETLSEKQSLQRLAAARGAERLHAPTVRDLLREKFDEAAFRSGDDCLCRILWLLVTCPDYQPLVREATWTKLQNYVREIPSHEAEFLLVALEVAPLHESAVIRLAQSSKSELSRIVSGLQAKPNKAFIERCISTYSGAENYDDANTMASMLIEPLIKYMETTNARAVIAAAGENSQVRDSFNLSSVAWSIKSSSLLSKEALMELIQQYGLQAKLGYLVAEEAQF